MIPTTIILPPKDYDNLLAILKWEQSMPSVLNDYLGDRYSEYMWNAERDHIPTELEDWEYISHIEVNDDKIVVVFGSGDVEPDEFLVPVIRGES